MKKIIYISDFDIRGSGYRNISMPLCQGLIEKGHEIGALGLGYKGEEHNFPYKLMAAKDFGEIYAMIHNLMFMWQPDLILASLDIPWHDRVMKKVVQEFPKLPYVGIFPIESDPLCLEWAMILMQMKHQFVISQFGTDECHKMGVPAEHFPVGIDSQSWRFPTVEERSMIRKSLGFIEDEYVVLTVADNQERKNLGRALQSISLARKLSPVPIRYVLVTREHNEHGFKLRSLAARSDIAINDIFYIFERGVDFTQLWSIYAAADAFFLPSKAEGLGMPLLEAMACGVPCIATNCSGMKELLSDGRGILLQPEIFYPDVFGNGNRYIISAEEGAKGILHSMKPEVREWIIPLARSFVEGRSWQVAVDLIDKCLGEIK